MPRSTAIDIDGQGGTCVAEIGGDVRCWGYSFGNVPNLVDGVETAVAIENGCALGSEGDVYCWDGLSAARADWEGQAQQLTKGYNQVCVVDDAEQLYCWGIGLRWDDGVQHCRGVLSQPVALPGPAVDLSTGYYDTCAALESGELYCWLDPNSVAVEDGGLVFPREPQRIDVCR